MAFLYGQLEVGDFESYQKTITTADVLLFGAVSGDFNPVHMDDEYAKTTQFQQRIAHGALTASLISAALTKAFPGSIYISQYCEFIAPVYLGDTIKAVVTCAEKLGKGRVRMETNVYKHDGTMVLKGEAITRLQRDPE